MITQKVWFKFINPPSALLASGSKIGVELGGSKIIVSIDNTHNLSSEGNIFTELSWGEFFKEEGIQDQIDTFTTKEMTSVREDPNALTETIVKSLRNIMREHRLFYGIIDFECDAFMNLNTVIKGLTLDQKIINKLLDAHKKNRDANRFPQILKGGQEENSIKITIQGTNKKKLFYAELEKMHDFADILRFAKGFSTGIVCTSRTAAVLFMMNDMIVFKENEVPQLYIDKYCIDVIESGIQRDKLFPVSWFRVDIGIRSLETLELWDQIKDKPELKKMLADYEDYITSLIVTKYKGEFAQEVLTTEAEDAFYNMTPEQAKKAKADMLDAINILTKMYKED